MNDHRGLIAALDELAWARPLLKVAMNSLQSPNQLDDDTIDGIIYLLGLIDNKAQGVQKVLKPEEVA